MADAPPNSDDLISQFVNLVQVSPQVVSYSIPFFPILSYLSNTSIRRQENTSPTAHGTSPQQSLNIIIQHQILTSQTPKLHSLHPAILQLPKPTPPHLPCLQLKRRTRNSPHSAIYEEVQAPATRVTGTMRMRTTKTTSLAMTIIRIYMQEAKSRA